MNINLIKLKAIASEMRGIRIALERMADCWEREQLTSGIIVEDNNPKDEPSFEYVDEEMDWAREEIDFVRNQERREDEERKEY